MTLGVPGGLPTSTTVSPKSSVGQDALPSLRWRPAAPDFLIAVALMVTAFVLRRRGLPDDGLWHDDAATALGAVKGSLSQLLTVSFDHPGFTALLRAWWPFTGEDSLRMPYLALAAGTLSPPALYLVLCRLGFARSIGALLGAALVASEMDIIYSGRVKTYTLDVLVVLGLALLVPVLARRSWRWQFGIAWFAGAAIIGSLSAFALIATAVAGIILVLHSRSDRTVRVISVGAQLATSVVFLAAVHRTYDAEVVATYWKRELNGFLDFDLNPVRFGGEVIEHLTRVAVVYPGGPAWWATICVLAAGVGLLTFVRDGRNAIRARFLLLLALVAFAAGVLEKVPFGPKVGAPGNGGRVTLWLVPVMAFGLAAILQLCRHRITGYSPLRVTFDVVAFGLAIAVVMTALGRDLPRYPFPGSKSATRFVEAELGKRDVVFVLPGGRYAFALDSHYPLKLRAQPSRSVGFAPQSRDQRVNYFDSFFVPDRVTEEIETALKRTHRVIIHAAAGGGPAKWLYTLGLYRAAMGFTVERSVAFHSARVVIWRR
jgi:hypothetical protein